MKGGLTVVDRRSWRFSKAIAMAGKLVTPPLGLGEKRHQVCFNGAQNFVESKVQQNLLSSSNVEGERKATYADKAKQRMNQAVDLATLPIPTMRGERPAITIPVSYVEKGLEACKFALVGRLDLKNVKIEDIKAEIAREWGLEATVRVSPLGKGYVMVRFSNENDFKRVWYGGPWQECVIEGVMNESWNQKKKPQAKKNKQDKTNEVELTVQPQLELREKENNDVNDKGATNEKEDIIGTEKSPLMVPSTQVQDSESGVLAVMVEESMDKSPVMVPDSQIEELESGEFAEVVEDSLLGKSPPAVPNFLPTEVGNEEADAELVEDSIEEKSPTLVPTSQEENSEGEGIMEGNSDVNALSNNLALAIIVPERAATSEASELQVVVTPPGDAGTEIEAEKLCKKFWEELNNEKNCQSPKKKTRGKRAKAKASAGAKATSSKH
ncbi:hypothetical protein FRX31_032353 [Thalictrum thalictroides]|uniref:DUF4283 domain-containing protein n=1 Tax=Thalictrum thalictroides TaxID=46969 RepID=A0A7J6V112_THATH|nr:hypothetical protein FRX31_032353 [Thalictrum thalictroides]